MKYTYYSKFSLL